ncbi:hypothetical protein [Pseudomonas sp. NPDC089569]|uniref:hypothetical protein n=1 Tax=Pseudomonas sp. NPDC089569 TaxID=3390722 RepID=UPI003D086B4A
MREALMLADFPPAARELYLKIAKEYAVLGGDIQGAAGIAVQEMPACLMEALRIAVTPNTTSGFPPHCEDFDEHH